MGISVQDINKRFGNFHALKGVNLDVASGELLALLGPSGSGKTTLLRIIAGLDQPDTGSVILHGEDATSKNPRERLVGFVFQHYALFRHMTVFENIAFGLRVKPRRLRPSRDAIRAKVLTLLELVQLERFHDRYPAQLSGGQRQRVALARALAVEPKLLLLDEPFGSLDAKVRKELRRWLRRLHDEIHVTSVFVTHDQEEALEVADRVVVMNEGRIEQTGTPEEVYHRPCNPFVYNFLGDVNLFHGRVHQDGQAHIRGVGQPPQAAAEPTAPVYVRPHLLDIALQSGGPDCIPARVTHVNPAGPYVKVELQDHEGNYVQANLSQERYQELHIQRDMDVFLIARETRTFIEEP